MHSIEYSANNLNQITQVGTNEDFAYDADGNLTVDGTWTYGYDREGRLISATDGTTSVTYSYDAVGRRMSKTVGSTTTQYVYSGQDLIEERDGSGAVLARYIYAGGIDNPVAVVRGTNTYFYQQDALGNVTAITDSTGAIVESYTYDVFGQPTIKDGDGDPVDEPMQPYLFTGREWDAETGLYHYRTRAYSPELGRFLQADSIGFGGGDMNLYRYVGNNPVNYVDPMGTEPWGRCEEDIDDPDDPDDPEKEKKRRVYDLVRIGVDPSIAKQIADPNSNLWKQVDSMLSGYNSMIFRRESGFTVGKDGTVSPITKAKMYPFGEMGHRPEPSNTGLGVHHHLKGSPSTPSEADRSVARRLGRPEMSVNAKGTHFSVTNGRKSQDLRSIPRPK